MPANNDLPVEGGSFVAVVGPSGAGKDTLLNHARNALADRKGVFFVRRVITRAVDGDTEDHTPSTLEEFDKNARDDRFAFHWEAHGLKYGLPIEIDDRIRAGECAVCNGSRAVLPSLSKRYANFLVVSITASPEILADRLAARGRESTVQIRARLERGAGPDDRWPDAVIINNSGPVEAAGNELVAAILKLASAT